MNQFEIIKITNISDFDFNGALGARFDGHDFLIPAGGSLLIPKQAGLHLAKHLARAILLRGAPIRDDKELNGRGSELVLWNEENEKVLMEKMISSSHTEEKPVVKTEGELLKEKVQSLNDNVGKEDESDEDAVPTASEGEITYRDKAQVIAELKKRSITFDPRSTKTTLEALLK